MMFWRDGWLSRAQRAAALAATTIAVAVLASCGGGEQVKTFAPGRVIAFGDETSFIASNGDKYTVNFESAPTDTPPSTRNCTQNAVWVQIVANAYAIPFPQCPGALTVRSRPSQMNAAFGAKVADVGTQVDNFLLTDSFSPDDLVTILAGANDIWAIYQTTVSGGVSVDQAVAAAEQAGTDLSGVVNRVAQAGAKVLISTVPDQSLTPDGRADATAAATLHRLSQRFNAKLRIGLIDDGRIIGLVLFDESVQSIVNLGTYNTTDKACNDATVGNLLTCTTQTLRTITDSTGTAVTASTATWLWADGTHIAPLGQTTLGSLAYARATNNPF